MSGLNPQVRKLPSSGKIELTWTPDPTAFGYRFFRDGRPVSKSTNPAQHTTTFAAETDLGTHTYGVARALTETAETVTFPAPAGPAADQFGARLYEGFEWSQQQIVGTTKLVTTKSELLAAIASSADVIEGGPGAVIDLGNTELKLPAHSSFRAIKALTIRHGRILKPVKSKWRLDQVTCQFGAPEDDIKGDNDGAFLHLRTCDIAHAPRQGMLLYHSDVVAEYTRFHHNGSQIDGNLDHGTYGAHGKRMLQIRCTNYENYAYALQLYPSWQQARLAQCTYYGGTVRGGAVFGSENPVDGNNPSSSADLWWIGCISANSASYGWTQYKEALRCKIEYCVGWNNRQGDYTLGFQPVGFVHGDPKFKSPVDGDFSTLPGGAGHDVIPEELWPWTTSADAGSGLRAAA